MADFAMRAAYYLGLPASGPTPLPKIIERWTMPRSNFVHKKSQENFERITLRRLVQIQDGHPETVQVWLAFLRKHAFYGVGMKANVWQHEELGTYLRACLGSFS
jgi:ribosomal protein S10